MNTIAKLEKETEDLKTKLTLARQTAYLICELYRSMTVEIVGESKVDHIENNMMDYLKTHL